MTDEQELRERVFKHKEVLTRLIDTIAADLRSRAAQHDLSKLQEPEFSGFAKVQKIARDYPMDSKEYQESVMKAPCIQHHITTNRHHPEFHEDLEDMNLGDMIEMVCDWLAAMKVYGNMNLVDSLKFLREKHGFSDRQWWAIKKIVDYILPPENYIC